MSSRGQARILIGGGILAFIVCVAVLAPWLAPHNPNDQDLLQMLAPPAWSPDGDWSHPLGTDNLGRDVLSRLIYGARVAAIVGTIVPIGTCLLGSSIAIVAGYYGGYVDKTLSRIVDIWMSFPAVVLSLVLMVGLSPGLRSVILATVLVDWTRFCRITRGAILGLMKLEYISAARITGASHVSIMLRDLVPGVLPLIITLLCVEIGVAVVVESILSFVGVSVEPHIPTWGVMIADGLASVFQAPWCLVFPMLAVILTVMAANMMGDGLRIRFDARIVDRTRAPA